MDISFYHSIIQKTLSTAREIYLSVCLSICLSVCLSVCLSIYLSVYLSVCLSVYLSFYLSVCLSIYLPVCLSICMSVYLSVCLSIYLSVYISIQYDLLQLCKFKEPRPKCMCMIESFSSAILVPYCICQHKHGLQAHHNNNQKSIFLD